MLQFRLFYIFTCSQIYNSYKSSKQLKKKKYIYMLRCVVTHFIFPECKHKASSILGSFQLEALPYLSYLASCSSTVVVVVIWAGPECWD